jgi:hypothetical protein
MSTTWINRGTVFNLFSGSCRMVDPELSGVKTRNVAVRIARGATLLQNRCRVRRNGAVRRGGVKKTFGSN